MCYVWARDRFSGLRCWHFGKCLLLGAEAWCCDLVGRCQLCAWHTCSSRMVLVAPKQSGSGKPVSLTSTFLSLAPDGGSWILALIVVISEAVRRSWHRSFRIAFAVGRKNSNFGDSCVLGVFAEHHDYFVGADSENLFRCYSETFRCFAHYGIESG